MQYASGRARCGVAGAARLHRRLQHPPPLALGFSLAAVLPLACLTSRPAALRDAPRSFTFKIIRNHCKNSLMAEGNGEISVEEVPGKDSDVGRTPDYRKLIEYGLDPKVAGKLDDIYKTGKLAHIELDERALDALKEFPSDGALSVLGQFLDSNLEHVSNKSAYLCGVMKTYRQKSRAGVQGAPALTATVPVKGPDEEKIKQILARTGYSLDVTTGQRKYGGPPPGWEGGTPGAGCEVFCGKIPKDMYEDELIPLFERCGTIWDLRLMMDPMTGTNRGYAFVTFTTREATQRAVQELDNHEIKPGKTLRIKISVPNLRLFVGNIPKSKGKEEILEEFGKLTAGLVEVIIYSSPDDKKKNRGFCFLEYESHKAASLAKRRLGTGRIKVWGCDIIVDWADPQEEPDEQTMSKVKVLYVRNLTQEITEEALKEEFEHYGTVERVKKIKDYAFVHFEDRDCAVKAMHELDGKEMGGARLEVSLAKPPSDRRRRRRFCAHASVWGCDIIVDWADPQEEPDEQTMSKVKVLYVRNLTQEITEEALKEEFEHYGTVERVKKIKDYAFVHFEDRDCAVKIIVTLVIVSCHPVTCHVERVQAMHELDGKEMGGARLEVSLAKPPSDKKKKEEILRARERRMTQMIYGRGG
ncbi:Heterogeneous nuclear ribonucleoprotein R [Papilio machaon]|uniref:Heterogeneous nuclear ribonucleoprotein R n=1 Tax=Papilio machaon TaxID=76193 RepID=A0A194R7F0_PAPMA|nr:Heterogeneous nuclear ribonucleoprotein R [Papilio machaon]